MAGERAGLINVYVCEACGGHTVTKNRDEGTTPFMISCRATVGCKGVAQSSFYRVSQNQTPVLLWIKPTPEELERFIKAQSGGDFHTVEIRRHVSMGGLLDVEAPKPERPTNDAMIRKLEEKMAEADAVQRAPFVSLLADIDEWLGNRDGLMIEDVIRWREKLATAIGAEPRK